MATDVVPSGAPRRASLVTMVVVGLAVGAARAEPYLAVRTGLKCSSCHENRTGGGERNAYGSGYGRKELPASERSATGAFDGLIVPRVRVGADLRAGAEWARPKDGSSLWSFEIFGAQVYGNFEVLADRLSFYVDEQIAPGGAASREAFALFRPLRGSLWIKAGRFFPPYGLRLQDDEAFTRSATGFDFGYSDIGVEVGVEPGSWSLVASATNGAGGAAESNNGKQASFVGSYVRPSFRLGLTAAYNDLPEDERRTLAGVFGGARAGPVVFLAEWDAIRDDPGGLLPPVDGSAAHLEADWLVVRGVTIRAWCGRHDPNQDIGSDTETQAGVGVDWTPLPGAQFRAYYRRRDGPDSVPASRGDETSLEVHLYF